MQSTTLSSATHAMPSELGGKWGKEVISCEWSVLTPDSHVPYAYPALSAGEYLYRRRCKLYFTVFTIYLHICAGFPKINSDKIMPAGQRYPPASRVKIEPTVTFTNYKEYILM